MRLAYQILKWILITLAGATAILAVTLSAVAIWVISNPAPTWQYLQTHYLPADLKLNWGNIDFQFNHVNGLNFAFKWQVTNFDIAKDEPKIHARLDDVKLEFQFNTLSSPHIQIRKFSLSATEPVTFMSGDTPPQSEPRNPSSLLQSYADILHKYAHHVAVEQLRLVIADIQLSSVTNPNPSHIALLMNKSDSRSIALNIEVKDLSEAIQKIRIKADVLLNAIETKTPFSNAKIEIQGPGLSVDSPFALSYYDDVFRVQSLTKVRYRRPKTTLSAQPNIDLRISRKKIELEVGTRIDGIPGPLMSLQDVSLTMSLPISSQSAWFDDSAEFNLQAPIALFFVDKNMRKPIEKSCHCKLPETLLTTLKGKFWPKNILESGQGKYPVLDARFAIQSVSNKLFSANLGGQVRLMRQSGSWLLDPTLDSEVIVHSFQGLRQFLDSMNILIPAPLSVLDGSVTVTARSPVQLNFEKTDLNEIKIAGQVDVDLKSKTQIVKFKTDIDLTAPRRLTSISVGIKTHIQQLRLELPPFDPIRGIPNFARDERIQLSLKKPSAKSDFKVFVSYSIDTATPGAIKLLSKLASPFVPVTVGLQQKTNSDLLGTIKIEPFQITYLRRTLFVESFKLGFVEDANSDLPIDGSFRVEQTDYVVKIHIGGTLGAPFLKLDSEPYLDRSDIISVLLYDRTRDQLGAGDAETAGGVQAAVADRAIGLFGLWAFATTPIKSFSYNPTTKVYTATVAIGGGLTAGVGTNWESGARLEVRKRISKKWVLAASWVPKEDAGTAGQIVLQWEKRF